jgi:hypothetical protein
LHRRFGVTLRGIENAAIKVLIAGPNRAALGRASAGRKRLAHIDLLKFHAVPDALRIFRPVGEQIAAACDRIVAVGREHLRTLRCVRAQRRNRHQK